MFSGLKKALGLKKSAESRDDESFFFLPQARGVIHIGANYGQERDLYAQHGLSVLWFECIPEVFEKLKANISGLAKQRAVLGLLTDRDGREHAFHLSDNEGAASSSIFQFARHKEIWPDVKMVKEVKMRGSTLPEMLKREGVNFADYDALVMDTQGSELLVLQGARAILPNFRFVKVEAADFPAYEGGCVLSELDAFMTEAGFKKTMSKPFAGAKGVGTYYEVVYTRGN